MNFININNKGSANLKLIIAISVLITGGLLFYSWNQLLPTIVTSSQSAAKLEVENKELGAKVKEIKEAQVIVNRITPSMSSLDLALPETSQYPELLVMIGAMARDSGLTKISALDIGTEKNSENVDATETTDKTTESFKPATFSISALGFYENANIFLDNLYSNIRTVYIDKISLKMEERSDENSQIAPGQINFTFSGFTYSRPAIIEAKNSTKLQ